MMRTKSVFHSSHSGTHRETYEIGQEGLERLRELGVETETGLIPYRTIEAIYSKELGDNYDSLSLTATDCLGREYEIATETGDDIDDWHQIRLALKSHDIS